MKHNTKQSILALFAAAVLALPASALAAEPGNVTGLSAVATDANSITLSWNASLAEGGQPVDHYRVYYGPQSVFAGEALYYENEVNTPTNATSFVLAGLEPATTYYFAVTAIDANDVESVEYSLETNAATPAEDAGDTVPPVVMSAVALDSTHVTVRFSESVTLPEQNPQNAFSIAEQLNPASMLEVLNAEIYQEDPSGRFVLLETGSQTADVNYVVTAGIGVTDQAGNPLVSGNTDSALFKGSSQAANSEPATDEETNNEQNQTTEEPENQDTAAPNETEVFDCGVVNESQPTQTDSDVLACFEARFKTCTPATYTHVSGAGAQQMNKVYEIKSKSGELCQVSTTYTQHPTAGWANQSMTCDYSTAKNFEEAQKDVLASLGKTPELGNCQGGLHTLIVGNSVQEPANEQEEDTTPPEEITGLMLSFKEMAESFMVMMDWTRSVDSAKDLMDQILYQSTDLGATYDGGTSLGKEANHYEVADLEGGKEYTFKIATKDAAGNESVGVVKSIRLPQTGVGAGLLLLGSSLGAYRVLRRKRK